MQTTYYYLNTRTDWTVDGPVEKGFEQTHTLKVTSTIADTSKVIDAAVKNGANRVDTIEYIVTKDGENIAVADAMSKATLAAKKKAQAVAAQMGNGVGRVLKIEEAGWYVTPSSEAEDSPAIPQEYVNNLISPQRMAVRATVNVVFALS